MIRLKLKPQYRKYTLLIVLLLFNQSEPFPSNLDFINKKSKNKSSKFMRRL